MPKAQKKANVCPICGTEVSSPDKTWNLVSPLPDEMGRITVTLMGSFTCPNCGYKWKGVISKIKVGGSEVEVEAGGKKKSIKGKAEEESRKEVIIVNLDENEEE
ncbi:MAG: chromatin protein Cren7 [Fervidicoccaceae archaeon]